MNDKCGTNPTMTERSGGLYRLSKPIPELKITNPDNPALSEYISDLNKKRRQNTAPLFTSRFAYDLKPVKVLRVGLENLLSLGLGNLTFVSPAADFT